RSGANARTRVAGLGNERVVRLAAAEQRAREAQAVLDADDGRDAEQRLAEVGLELVEHRLAEARGNAGGDDLAHAADRVLLLAHALDERDHLRGALGVRTAHE